MAFQVRPEIAESKKESKVAVIGPSQETGIQRRSWVSIFWDEDFDSKSPEEQKLVRKIDIGILIYACFGYFVKTLDQNNINNAFVSGMREDLGMYGNELNYATLSFNVPYCVVKPSLYLPILELFWAVITIGKAFSNTPQQLYVAQFFLGMVEAGYFPGIIFLIGEWYTKTELSKRFALFAVTSSLGAMFSGYLQAAVYTNLNGSNGLAGWKWLFVVDGFISLASAVIGFVLIPDFPKTTTWRFFTKDEIALAVSRLERDGRQEKLRFDWSVVKRVLGRWHFWLFVPLYAIYNSASTAWSYLSFLLKFTPGYAVWQINIYPTGVYAVTVVAYLVTGWYADYFNDRFSVIFYPMAVSFAFVTILAVWNVPFNLLFASYFGAAVSAPIATSMAYLTAIVDSDPVERTLIIGAMNSASYAIFIIGQIWLWPTVSAPSFPVGYSYTAASLGVGLVVTITIQYLWKRDLKRGIVHTADGSFVRQKENLTVRKQDVEVSKS
ncbi:hypothetical protein SmJEL517_g03325 [Synchytrium microbalum]|uniref:Major facilitator superfamily (MFS) profile domain-containing protein n=1 Tax=Synchytrium microbalum TaxID=1806994 RepID=A0A507C6Z9_9FUNG|nr:uncharacterized protein SmJEL517_g03325 [Synchytrium microbalum]TPX33834.1 hypothetical protein SmJEL517_g03325 [Synchytrium microbalum]